MDRLISIGQWNPNKKLLEYVYGERGQLYDGNEQGEEQNPTGVKTRQKQDEGQEKDKKNQWRGER